MSFLIIYQNLKSIFTKFRKNNIMDKQGNDLGDLVVTLNGEVVPRWYGTEDSFARTEKPNDEDDLSIETVS